MEEYISHRSKRPTFRGILVKSLQSCPTLCDPMDCIALQAPLSMGFSRQEYWSRLPCPPPGDLPEPGIEPVSPALAGGFFTSEPSVQFSSVSHSVVSDSLRPHESQHARPPCPSPTPHQGSPLLGMWTCYSTNIQNNLPLPPWFSTELFSIHMWSNIFSRAIVSFQCS